MLNVTVRDLMQAGAHFGHQTRRWDPRMRDYIFCARNGIHIIDLDKTAGALQGAYEFMRELVAQGKQVLFVATKRQAQDSIREICEEIDMPYVVYRWLGGTLTNFNTIRGSISRLESVEEIINSEERQQDYVKKEIVKMSKEVAKLTKQLGGILNMKHLPGALFVIDPKTERIAVAEAKRLGIPVIGLVDTNCNPNTVDHVIPANDDALKSIELFSRAMADACQEGRKIFEKRAQEMNAEEAKKKQEAVAQAKAASAKAAEAKTPASE